MKNRLSLRTERLAELTTDDLHQVAGGQEALTVQRICVSLVTGCPSVNYCTTAQSCGCSPSWNCS